MKEEAKKTKRDEYLERLRSKYPDREFADDESLYEQANADYEDYENQLSGYREREGKLTDLFSRDPRSAQFLVDMAKGKDPWIAVINRLGIDGVMDLINDPAKQKEYAEANKQYVERLAKAEKLEEEFGRNLEESLSTLERMQQERGLDNETMNAAYDLVIEMANEAALGKFTEQTIDMALKAVNYDADVADAEQAGEVRGRNAKIEERLRKRDGGDGTPQLGGKGGTMQPQGSGASIFEIAKGARV